MLTAIDLAGARTRLCAGAVPDALAVRPLAGAADVAVARIRLLAAIDADALAVPLRADATGVAAFACVPLLSQMPS